MIRTLASVVLTVASLPACAGGIEHWTCQVKIGSKVSPQDYTLADNRLFAPKGKGSWSLVYNSDEAAFAYVRLPRKDTAITDILVLDKRAGKLIWYNDIVAINSFKWNPETDPDIRISECRRMD